MQYVMGGICRVGNCYGSLGMNFAPIWKLLNAGMIDSAMAFAMCPAWVTVERFNRQYARFMTRTRKEFTYGT